MLMGLSAVSPPTRPKVVTNCSDGKLELTEATPIVNQMKTLSVL
jgi:hypothetical protein